MRNLHIRYVREGETNVNELFLSAGFSVSLTIEEGEDQSLKKYFKGFDSLPFTLSLK
ncbi:MAG: hypothetical protein R2795_22560 [Saprospiraceae bacterium]